MNVKSENVHQCCGLASAKFWSGLGMLRDLSHYGVCCEGRFGCIVFVTTPCRMLSSQLSNLFFLYKQPNNMVLVVLQLSNQKYVATMFLWRLLWFSYFLMGLSRQHPFSFEVRLWMSRCLKGKRKHAFSLLKVRFFEVFINFIMKLLSISSWAALAVLCTAQFRESTRLPCAFFSCSFLYPHFVFDLYCLRGVKLRYALLVYNDVLLSGYLQITVVSIMCSYVSLALGGSTWLDCRGSACFCSSFLPQKSFLVLQLQNSSQCFFTSL